jgi:lipopolysaccharide export system protein LptA
MSANDDYVTFIELRGDARVEGGAGSLDSMSARDIDLDYTDDGKALERVVLTGNSAVAMTGLDGAAGRSFTGSSFDLRLATDGSVTAVTGRDNVRVNLPAGPEAPARNITARALDATGASGQGLSDLQFTDKVEYREEPRGGARGATAGRTARSQALRLGLAQDTVTSAVFTGKATFEEQGLSAAAAEFRYEPDRGALHLTGRDGGAGPSVSDDQVTVEAPMIDVALEGHRMSASGTVKTTLRPPPAATGGRGTNATAPEGSHLPGLLKQDAAAKVNSDSLDYQGSRGNAIFEGNALLWQGETAVRADTITIDQATGDFVAVGSTRSTLAFDDGVFDGRANDLRFDDAQRVVSFSTTPPAPAAAAASESRAGRQAPTGEGAAARPTGRGSMPRSDAQLIGPQLEMHADRIDVKLAETGSRVQSVEAYTKVTAKVDTRVATGGRLTYHAEDERYDISGTAAAPVKVVETCREITGMTLTFFKSADRIIVDGNEKIRTRTENRGVCAQTAPPSR